jgi:hypothetical protein
MKRSGYDRLGLALLLSGVLLVSSAYLIGIYFGVIGGPVMTPAEGFNLPLGIYSASLTLGIIFIIAGIAIRSSGIIYGT